MLDYDLAVLYETETKRLNQQVKRNLSRFPEDFMFQLSKAEWKQLRSQIVTTSVEANKSGLAEKDEGQKKRNTAALPYVFTEHGVTMLAGILRSEKAIKMSIAVVRAFIALKELSIYYSDISDRFNEIQGRIDNHDEQLILIYDSIENMLDEKAEQESWKDRQRIGFNK